MLRKGLLISWMKINSIKQSLKVLQLKIPTSKTQIKKQYLSLAKKYHPDSADADEKVQNGKHKDSKSKTKKATNIDMQIEQKFVNINKAYQYLKDIPENDINSNKQTMRQSNDQTTKEQPQQKKAKMSTEELKRQQSYQYFNKKYYQRNQANRSTMEEESYDQQRKPLYKTVPQFFIGFLLLAIVLGDWTYRVLKRKYNNEKKNPQKQKTKNEQQQMKNAFKRMNHNTIFSQQKKIEMIE